MKKMLPHIETPSSRAEFDKFAAAGKELMALHVDYESVEPCHFSKEDIHAASALRWHS